MARPGVGMTATRAIEGWVIAANAAGGLLVAAYLIGLSDVDPGESVARVWIGVLSSSLSLSAVAAVVTVVLGHRFLAPLLTFLDEGRPATPRERDLLVATPRYIMLGVYAGWTAAGVLVATSLFLEGQSRDALAALVGNLLGGLVVGNLSYLLAERQLRPAYAVMFSTTSPGERPHFTARRRLLLAWSLGSGIPLLGIALTPGVRDPNADVPAVVPMVILACTGLAVGALISLVEASALADPMTQLRRAMARVREGDLDTAVAVDSAGEVGLVQAGFNEMVAGLRDRDRLQDLFGRHVGEDVARRAMEQGVALGGDRREATVLFVDLVGSTAMARNTAPEAVVATLNRFFRAVVDCVTAEGGWVNKFEGDGAMCVFGVPVPQADHSARGLRAAAALRTRLLELGLDAGIGVATGQVVAGHVGTEARHEYTVIGQPVNEAARLTDVAKIHSDRVLTSAADYNGWLPAGTVELRGIGIVTVFSPP